MNTVSLVVAAIAMSAAHPALAQTGATARIASPATSTLATGMEANTNRPGSDYRNFDSASAQQCRSTCSNEAQCRAWSWVKPGAPGAQGRCWLKSAVPATRASSCCISGLGKAPPAAPAKASSAFSRPAPAPASNSGTVTQGWRPGAEAKPSTTAEQRAVGNLGPQGPKVSPPKASTSEGVQIAINSGTLEPAILRIDNSRPQGYVLKPGIRIVIFGRGFGENAGTVRLDKVRNPNLLSVVAWLPDKIAVDVPPNVSGEEDQDDITLEVLPHKTAPILVRGLRFRAAHEVTLLRLIPPRMVTLMVTQEDKYPTPVDADYATEGLEPQCNGRKLSRLELQPAMSPVSAYVARCTESDLDLDWFKEGVDTYALGLRPGFQIDHFEFATGRTDTDKDHCSGSQGSVSGGQYVRGKYEVSQTAPNTIQVSWAVWRCHQSPWLTLGGHDRNESFYGLNVYVDGPRGVSPYTGAQ